MGYLKSPPNPEIVCTQKFLPLPSCLKPSARAADLDRLVQNQATEERR